MSCGPKSLCSFKYSDRKLSNQCFDLGLDADLHLLWLFNWLDFNVCLYISHSFTDITQTHKRETSIAIIPLLLLLFIHIALTLTCHSIFYYSHPLLLISYHSTTPNYEDGWQISRFSFYFIVRRLCYHDSWQILS